MKRGEYAGTKEAVCPFSMERGRIDMKKLKINVEYTDDNKLKDNKKSFQISEFLKAIFASLIASLIIYLFKVLFSL